MDKTEQFIKMADCPEVQKYRKKQKDFQIGDLIANYILGKYSKATFQGIITFEQHDEIRDRQLAVWLPRQDDIQGMCGAYTKAVRPIYQLMMFWRKIKKNGKYYPMFKTWEQLWLAFYMYEKHQKAWSSKEEKWVLKS